jgi:hypothetical protein
MKARLGSRTRRGVSAFQETGEPAN